MKIQERLVSIEEADGLSMFETKCLGKDYSDKIILLGKTIYGTNVPDDSKNKLFKYQVMSFDTSSTNRSGFSLLFRQ